MTELVTAAQERARIVAALDRLAAAEADHHRPDPTGWWAQRAREAARVIDLTRRIVTDDTTGNPYLTRVLATEPPPCPRCGHDTPGDPSRKPDGDHLVRVETPLQVTVDEGSGRESNHVTMRASQDVCFALCSTLPNHLRPPKPEPEPAPEPVVLSADEQRPQIARIGEHLATFYRLRTAALHDYRQVTRWTLPADWNPGPHIDAGEPHRPADPYPDARLLGLPVTFAGALIVAHLDDGTERTADPSARPQEKHL